MKTKLSCLLPILFFSIGCIDMKAPLVSERRSIAYERVSISREGVEIKQNGNVMTKTYFSVSWNLKPGSQDTTLAALKKCITELRQIDKTDLARMVGNPKFEADFIAFEVFRASATETGTYEYGLIVPFSDVFSEMPIEQLIRIGKSTGTPVKLLESGWDFSWFDEQIVRYYEEVGF